MAALDIGAVPEAFRKRVQGDDNDYGLFLKDLLAASDETSEASDVVRICEGLSSVLHIVCADVDKFESMISYLFQSKWLCRGDKGGPEGKQLAVCEAFAGVLRRLVSYDSSFANKCYEVVIKSLLLLRPAQDSERNSGEIAKS